MIDLIRENMAPILFGGLVLFLLLGYPAAFSLAAVGLFGGLAAIELGLIAPQFMGNLTYQLYGVLSNELLLAIPFFTFMGVILEKSGLAEDLLEGFGQLFGGLRGGLSYAVIIVGAILGVITGTVAASVIAMGLISLPVMMRYGYNVRHATGVIAASGTITQLIPPSLVLIVLADQLQRSPGEMYIGATGASIVQVLLFMGWVFILSIIRPQDVPALPPEARTLRGWPLWRTIIRGTVPSLALIFIVLGTILLGLVTPTEAGAMGVVGALLLAWMNGRLKWSVMPPAYQSLLKTACQATSSDMLAKYDYVNPTAIKKLVAAGAQLRPFSPEIMEASFIPQSAQPINTRGQIRVQMVRNGAKELALPWNFAAISDPGPWSSTGGNHAPRRRANAHGAGDRPGKNAMCLPTSGSRFRAVEGHRCLWLAGKV